MEATMRKVTDRQAAVLTYIHDYIDDHGYSPSVIDVAKAFSILPNAAWQHIHALQDKGELKTTYGVARSIVLTPKACKPV